MKRLLALLLCLVMCVTMIPAAFAGDIEIVDAEEEDLIPLGEPGAAPEGEKLAARPTITAQPASQTAYVGETVTFTVKATGAESYQWYYRKTAGDSWVKTTLTGAKTATLTVAVTAARNGYQYYCKVKNAAGATYSKSATLTAISKPKVTTQPMDYTAGVGAYLYLKVKADDAESYQWYYRTGDGGSWKKTGLTGNKTATLTVKATEARNGWQYRCKLSNPAGSSYSRAATLSVSDISCGESLRWKLSSGGLLTVSGSGAMADAPKEESLWKRYASQITRVSVGSGVTSVGKHAFYGLSSLRSVSLPSGLAKIGVYAFGSCSSLTGLKLPNGLTEIGANAFRSCGSLTSITIPDSVTSLGEYAFDYCGALKTVKIGSGVTSIGTWVFHYCDALESVTMSDSVTMIGYGAFYHTPGLKKITFSQNLTTIGNQAFESSGLTSVTLPDSVTSIGSSFSWCDSLTTVTIGKGMKSIGNGAFSYTFHISDVYYRGTKAQWNKIDIGGNNDNLLKATIHYNA